MELAVKLNVMSRVEDALDTMRPFLRTDGGDVELVDVDEEMNVKIRLLGQCRTCSMVGMTMKAGIEQEIRRAIPEVKSVTAVEAA
jgi:Fe-S cluster biogenesis protein NfuA